MRLLCSFFGPLCYSPMLQTMSDYQTMSYYALEISRFFFFIEINFTKQVTQYHSFSRISIIIIINNVSAYYTTTSKNILCSLGANCLAAPQHIYMCTYQATPTRLAGRTYRSTGTAHARGSRACTSLTTIPVFLTFISTLRHLHEITNYAGSYAHIIAASLVGREMPCTKLKKPTFKDTIVCSYLI